VESAYRSHAQILSTPAPPLEPEVKADLKKFLAVFFRNFHPKDLLGKLQTSEASTSASNTTVRSEGGARAGVQEAISQILDVSRDSLVRMVPTDAGIVEERGLLPPSRDEWRQIAIHPIDFGYDTLPKRVLSQIPLAWRDRPFSKVVALQEPLKIRIITKMQTLSTHLSGPFQQALWSHLGKFPCFDLTKKTFSLDNVYDLQAREEKLLGLRPDAEKLSGDYKSATDLLYLEATKMALEEAIAHLEPADMVLIPHFNAVLHEQVLVYPPEANHPPVQQANGQLMGSKLSFPFLCILNLFTYVQSLPEKLRLRVLNGKVSLKLLAALINGDDILFNTDKAQYARWLSATQSIGFMLSLGKNFVHPRFFTVNSLALECTVVPPLVSKDVGRVVTWSADPRHPSLFRLPSKISWGELEELPPWVFQTTHLFEAHGYINVGLLLGVARTTDERGRHDLVPLNGWYEWAVVGAMDPGRAHNLFLHYHKQELRRQTRFGAHTLNLFAHPLLGGLGFPVPVGVEPFFTQAQRHLASRLLDAASQGYQGRVDESPHKAIAFLSSETTTASLGTLGSHRLVRTGVGGFGPLPFEETPFKPDLSVRLTPLSAGFWGPEAHILLPSCRLSNEELRTMLKACNHGRSKMLSPASMSVFPGRIVSYDSLLLDTPPVDSIPINETPIPEEPLVSPPVAVPFVYDTSWEDDDPQESSPTPPPSLELPKAESAGKIRRREARLNAVAQGLVATSTVKDRRGSRWSRKAGRG